MTRPTPSLALEARVDGGPDTYRFETGPAATATDSFRTAELLLCETIWDDNPGRVLCPEANYGVTGVVLAAVADGVTMTESSARAVRLCERNAAANDADVRVELLADASTLAGASGGPYDTVAYAPKAYTSIPVGKQRIVDAMRTLGPGGTVHVAAPRQAGQSRYEDCLREVAGTVTRTAASDGCRVLRAERPAAFDPPRYVVPHTLRPTVDGVTLTLTAVPGLFAADGLDHGTRLLAEAVDVADGQRVLDLCCGYGALGTYAGTVADCSVWLTDDDRLATACAECSLERSGVTGTVVTGDGVDGVRGKTFDLVLCNPPTHARDDVLTDLFAGVDDVLAADGTVALVHHRDLDLRDHLAPFDSRWTKREGEEHVVVYAKR